MDIPSTEQQWIEVFFSAPNSLLWGDLCSGNVDDLLRDEVHGWLQFLEGDRPNSPVLVLRVSSQGTTWYAGSGDDRLAAQTAEELAAMVAHAYASVDRFPSLDSTDPCDNALLKRFGKHVCRVDVVPGKEKQMLRMLGIYRQLIERRPERPQIGVRPPGRIRSIFDKALLAGNFEEARKCIDELKESGRLDLQNQRFLEIRLLSVQEKWQVIVGDPVYLRTVVDLDLPARIIADLIEAIYQVHLRRFEDVVDPQGAIGGFRELVLPKYGRLFRARKGLKTPSVLKAFLIEQVCSYSPESSVCQRLLEEYPISDPGFAYAKSFLQIIPKVPVAKDLLDRAKDAFGDDKVELALQLYVSCPPDKDILAQVLRCSREVEGMSDLEVAWGYCQGCPEEWFEGLSAKQIRDYSALKEAFTAKPISNWIDWANFVLEGGDHKEAEALAQTGANEWSLDDFLAIADGVETGAFPVFVT